MRVDHGRSDISVTQQLLNRSNIIGILQQVGRGGRRGLFFTNPLPVFSSAIFLVLRIENFASTVISGEAQQWGSDWPGVSPFPPWEAATLADMSEVTYTGANGIGR